jgi:hypothetical protein
VGRTARLNKLGVSISLLMDGTNETRYPAYLKDNGINTTVMKRHDILNKFIFDLQTQYNTKQGSRLRKEEGKGDENYDILMYLRIFLKDVIKDKTELTSLCKVSYNSSLRAYSGHSFKCKDVFDIRKINITKFAKSLAYYKEISDSKKNLREEDMGEIEQDYGKKLKQKKVKVVEKKKL